MKWPENPLKLNTATTIQEIIDFIQHNFSLLDRKKAILGLSGGLDSSLTAALAAKAIGPKNVQLYYLPERDSKSIHRRHAIMLANQLDSELRIINITPTLKKLGIYRLLPLSLLPGRRLKARAVEFGKREFLHNSSSEFLSVRLDASGGPWVARGNAYIGAKHRTRSVVLYKEAERSRGLVIGAANKTEWMTGTFTQWGCDHCADLMPLLHLYRSQLIPIAEHLQLPREIREKKADPDVIPGLDDKGELLGSFEIADQILWGIDKGYSANDLAEQFGSKQVAYIMMLMENSVYYRETPYSLL